jgi:hypothetical protein
MPMSMVKRSPATIGPSMAAPPRIIAKSPIQIEAGSVGETGLE